MPKPSLPDLGAYLREQREHAQLSLRQVADAAGISNPYLSQIERGLKHPSAEILQAIAKGLAISAESLYIKAGLLEEAATKETSPKVDVRAAVLADPRLTDRQRGVLLDVYDSFVGPLPTPEKAVDEQLSTLPDEQRTAVTNLPARRRRGRRSTPLAHGSGAVTTSGATHPTTEPAPTAGHGEPETTGPEGPDTQEGNAS